MNDYLIEALNKEFKSSLDAKNTFDQERIDALKTVFGDKIKFNFLMKIFELVEQKTNSFNEINKYYRKTNNLMLGAMIGIDTLEIDVCNHITGVHHYNTMFMSPENRAVKQKDAKYREQLADQVIKQIKIRQYGSSLLRNVKIFGRENFLFYPPIYFMITYNMLLLVKLIEFNKQNLKKNDKNTKCLRIIEKILVNIKGIVAVIDYNNLENGYAIARRIIELYAIYIVLKYSSINFECYEKFSNYKSWYSTQSLYAEEFLEKYSHVDNSISKLDYMNFGWIDDIFEFGYLNKKKTYKFSNIIDLVNLLMSKEKKIENYGDNLKELYNRCHIYTHGGINGIGSEVLCLEELTNMCWTVLSGINEEVKDIIKVEEFNGINIFNEANNNIKYFHKFYERVDVNDFVKYYNKYV